MLSNDLHSEERFWNDAFSDQYRHGVDGRPNRRKKISVFKQKRIRVDGALSYNSRLCWEFLANNLASVCTRLWKFGRFQTLRNHTQQLPRTQTSLSGWKCARKGRRAPPFCTLPIVLCGSSAVARLYLEKNEVFEEEADVTTCTTVCKRTQHVTTNNVGSCWPTISRRSVFREHAFKNDWSIISFVSENFLILKLLVKTKTCFD